MLAPVVSFRCGVAKRTLIVPNTTICSSMVRRNVLGLVTMTGSAAMSIPPWKSGKRGNREWWKYRNEGILFRPVN